MFLVLKKKRKKTGRDAGDGRGPFRHDQFDGIPIAVAGTKRGAGDGRGQVPARRGCVLRRARLLQALRCNRATANRRGHCRLERIRVVLRQQDPSGIHGRQRTRGDRLPVLHDGQRPDAHGRVGPALRRRGPVRDEVPVARLSAVRAARPGRVLLCAWAVTTRGPVRGAAVIPGPGPGGGDGDATQRLHETVPSGRGSFHRGRTADGSRADLPRNGCGRHVERHTAGAAGLQRPR